MQKIDPQHRWSGRLPTDCLDLLPAECRSQRITCISDVTTWTSLWYRWRGGETQPRINFAKQFVVIVQNVRFLNRIRFQSATIDDGVLTIHSQETRTARPVRDELYCLVLVFNSAGIDTIGDGTESLPVRPHAKL